MPYWNALVEAGLEAAGDVDGGERLPDSTHEHVLSFESDADAFTAAEPVNGTNLSLGYRLVQLPDGYAQLEVKGEVPPADQARVSLGICVSEAGITLYNQTAIVSFNEPRLRWSSQRFFEPESKSATVTVKIWVLDGKGDDNTTIALAGGNTAARLTSFHTKLPTSGLALVRSNSPSIVSIGGSGAAPAPPGGGFDVYRSWQKPLGSYTYSYVGSRKQYGLVGLVNQGATCYLNSLLQSLFHTRLFRRIVYDTPVDPTSDLSTNLVFGLQATFHSLQSSDHAVSTQRLIKSFGWDERDAFTQHDVQELNRILCDHLAEKMKGTPMEGSLAKLFEGHTTTVVKCTNVNYSSEPRVETFCDLQLNVKGFGSVEESLKQYIADEELTGDNQYHTDEFGKQDATRQTRFTKLPPVLHLHLKRFEFSGHGTTKVNDYFSFPEVLDVSHVFTPPEAPSVPADAPAAGSQLDPAAPDAVNAAAAANLAAATDQCTRYVLHSVLVHSGFVDFGHYYAFIRPVMEPNVYSTQDAATDAASHPNGVKETKEDTYTDTDADMIPSSQPTEDDRQLAAALVAHVDDAGAAARPAQKRVRSDSMDCVLTGSPVNLVTPDLCAQPVTPPFPPYDEPETVSGWFRFDDSTVSPVSAREAINSNFGVLPESAGITYSAVNGVKRQNISNSARVDNAYMLVYIRESALPFVMPPAAAASVTPDDIASRAPQYVDISMDVPHQLAEELTRQQASALEAARLLNEERSKCTVQLITDESVQAWSHCAAPTSAPASLWFDASHLQSVTMKLTDVAEVLNERVCTALNQPMVKLWKLCHTPSKYLTIDDAMSPEDTMDKLEPKMVYVETLNSSTYLNQSPLSAGDNYPVFIKLFTPTAAKTGCPIEYLGRILATKDTTVAEITAAARHFRPTLGALQVVPAMLFAECGTTLEDGLTLGYKYGAGSVFIVTPVAAESTDPQVLATVKSWLQWDQQRRQVTIRPLPAERSESFGMQLPMPAHVPPSFEVLVHPKESTIDQVARIIKEVARLECDTEFIRITTPAFAEGEPSSRPEYDRSKALVNDVGHKPVLYFDLLQVPLLQAMLSVPIRCSWLGPDGISASIGATELAPAQDVTITVSRESQVSSVIQQLCARLNLPTTLWFRVYTLSAKGAVQQVCDMDCDVYISSAPLKHVFVHAVWPAEPVFPSTLVRSTAVYTVESSAGADCEETVRGTFSFAADDRIEWIELFSLSVSLEKEERFEQIEARPVLMPVTRTTLVRDALLYLAAQLNVPATKLLSSKVAAVFQPWKLQLLPGSDAVGSDLLDQALMPLIERMHASRAAAAAMPVSSFFGVNPVKPEELVFGVRQEPSEVERKGFTNDPSNATFTSKRGVPMGAGVVARLPHKWASVCVPALAVFWLPPQAVTVSSSTFTSQYGSRYVQVCSPVFHTSRRTCGTQQEARRAPNQVVGPRLMRNN